MCFKICCSQTQSQKDVFFATSIKELGHCTIVKHNITLNPGSKPVASRPYRLNPKMQDILNEQIDELLEADIIVPSDTRWRSPTILVHKKCGSVDLIICALITVN